MYGVLDVRDQPSKPISGTKRRRPSACYTTYVEDALQHVQGIESASIYGSWARRYRGEAGTEPQDIDLLVVGNPDVDLLRAVVEQAAATLGRDVNPTVLTSEEWSGGTSGFVTQLHHDALVDLDLRGHNMAEH